jgi:GNAT superfamily N-acetyltransferase
MDIRVRRMKAMAAPVRLRPLLQADMPAAHGFTMALAWPHRLEDWQFALSLGEGVAAEVGRSLAGTAIGWTFGADWAALGNVIVPAEQQGRGIGRRLMEALIPMLGDRGIVLHATEAGQPLYRSLGFVPCGTVCQHQGAPFSVGFHAPRAGERLRPAGRADLPVLAALDTAATGMQRGAVLAAVLDIAECIVLDREGLACGFAMLRRFGRGQLIGPVVAPDAEAARLLIAHWLGQRQGEFLRIDIPAETGLSPWLEELGLPQVDTVLRMARGTPPVPAAVRTYALVTQALG